MKRALLRKVSGTAGFYEQVYEVVKQIPIGKVSTYGRIAALLDKPRAARAVGYALSALKKSGETQIPWQRVINHQGRISARGDFPRANLQEKLLEEEGIVFDESGNVDLKKFGWPSL